MDAPSEEEARHRWTGRRITVPVCLAAAAVTAFAVAQTTSVHAGDNDRRVSLSAQSQAQPATQPKARSLERSRPAQGKAGGQDRAEAFTACMRSHGVTDFPGITVGKDGTVQLRNGGSVNPLSPTYKAAARACASLLPKGSALPGDPAPPSPSAPTLTPACESGCPAPPKAPELPF